MQKNIKIEKIAVCNNCGEELTEENAFGNSATCIECQSKYFDALERENGCHMALFLCCAAFNIPCFPDVAPIDLVNSKGDKWAEYLDLLAESGKMVEKDKLCTFFDGVKNIRAIFGKRLTENDFARFIEAEQQRIAVQIGTKEQITRWGEGELCRGVPYTTEIYNRLDRDLQNWKDRYKGQTITPQMESTLITITKRNLQADYLVRAGNYAGAEKLQKMVDTQMAAEQMRKKDEKPIENMRMDALVSAMEAAGCMEDGKLKTYDETVAALRDNFIASPKYKYSLDVADQMLFAITNAGRMNADMALLTELPEDMQPIDSYGEFEAEETEEEAKRKKYAGLTPVVYTSSSEGDA